MVWLARLTSLTQERELAQAMAKVRAAEYAAVLDEATQAAGLPDADRQRIMRKLRAELRRIHRRDYFPSLQRKAADHAVDALHPDRGQKDTA
ncbi:hypothetical protein [Lentzea kentuckyensis]|uniref:hypothetical protein n=1 Tax=Lentzea kentuckyensis TaxID=360086 RepID=UPI001B80CDF6|nr:hypothetical protein [Lentzea kentuckyensis]